MKENTVILTADEFEPAEIEIVVYSTDDVIFSSGEETTENNSTILPEL